MLFHTLILRRMCNYTAAGGRCGFSRDKKKKRKKENVSNERVDEELSSRWVHQTRKQSFTLKDGGGKQR